MPQGNKLTDLEIDYAAEETAERVNRALAPVGMETIQEKMAMLDRLGFAGDGDVVLLGLEDMEPELTMEQAERQHRLAPFVVTDRHRCKATPMSLAPIDDARSAREHDIDDMKRAEWDDET